MALPGCRKNAILYTNSASSVAQYRGGIFLKFKFDLAMNLQIIYSDFSELMVNISIVSWLSNVYKKCHGKKLKGCDLFS